MNDTAALWQAWCDGTAAPNPGRIGLGFVLQSPDGTTTEHALRAGCSGCNNEAELLAIVAALDLARQSGARRIRVCSDSRVAIDALTRARRPSAGRITALLDDAARLAAYFEAVEWQWIPGHRNLAADRLSRAALGLPEKIKKRHRQMTRL